MELLERLMAIGGLADFEPVFDQRICCQPAGIGVVIDNQYTSTPSRGR